MAILNNIKYLLLEKGCTQNDLCKSINIGKSALSNIISRKQNATLETAFDMANFFNKPIEEIFYSDTLSEKAVYQISDIILFTNDIYNKYKENNMYHLDILETIFEGLVDGYVNKYGQNIAYDLFLDYKNKEGNVINPIILDLFSKLK